MFLLRSRNIVQFKILDTFTCAVCTDIDGQLWLFELSIRLNRNDLKQIGNFSSQLGSYKLKWCFANKSRRNFNIRLEMCTTQLKVKRCRWKFSNWLMSRNERQHALINCTSSIIHHLPWKLEYKTKMKPIFAARFH